MGRRKHEANKETAEVKDILVEAAINLFAEKGFSSVTTKSIGERAGVNSAMIYYYFADKDAIFHQCLASLIDRISTTYHSKIENQESPAAIISSWLETHRTAPDNIVNLLKLMMDYSRSDVKNPMIDAQVERFYGIERSLIASAVPSGVEQDDLLLSRSDLAYFVSTHLDGIIARSILEKDYRIDEALDRLLAVFRKLSASD